ESADCQGHSNSLTYHLSEGRSPEKSMSCENVKS
ncbi:hypothetical protein TNCT_714451, partial [Trichonephila clavata]